MDKIISLVGIVIILFSYKILEKILHKLFPKIVKRQLWDSLGYYIWGLLLLGIYLYVKPIDYIISKPVNNSYGVIVTIIVIIVTVYGCVSDPNVYYPRKTGKLRCIHYSIIQPIFEEVAFRGLILPMMMPLLGNNGNILMLVNAALFMGFHLNYWSYNKENQRMFIGFLLIGMALGYVTLMTESIVYAVICHIIINGGNTLYRNLKDDKNKKSEIEA